MKSLVKKIFWGIASIMFFITLLAFAVLAPIKENHEISLIEDLNFSNFPDSSKRTGLKVGWCAVNITPTKPINLAGYGPRGPYQTVNDSLFSRVILFDDGQKEAVIISLDLLMFPRYIKERLETELGQLGFDQDAIYLTATHTHHGFGNWEKSLGGQFAFGNFIQKQSEILVQQIVSAVLKARKQKRPSLLGFRKLDANELVSNRLAPVDGKIDPYLRMLQIKNEVGEQALLVTYAGHATNLDADTWLLSGDYPGILVDNLEQSSSVDFAMFCAGMVGSHNIKIDIDKGQERIDKIGRRLASKILDSQNGIDLDSLNALDFYDLHIELPPSQMRISKHFHLRDWIFSTLLGPLKANVKILKIGDVLFVGMPCDYSGELATNNRLDELADEKNMHLIITSFNGNYVGYITEDAHYNTSAHDEVRVMNWVGPHMGKHFTDIIKKIIFEINS